MITEKAKYKYRVLVFWEKHGLEATMEAFQIKKRTLYDWKKKFNEHLLEVAKMKYLEDMPIQQVRVSKISE